jgi:hypothetical protein
MSVFSLMEKNVYVLLSSGKRKDHFKTVDRCLEEEIVLLLTINFTFLS